MRENYLDNQDRAKQYYLDKRDRINEYQSKNHDKINARKKFILIIDIKQIYIFV